MVEMFKYGLRLSRKTDVKAIPLSDTISAEYTEFGSEGMSCMICSLPDDAAVNSPFISGSDGNKLTITIPEAGTYVTSDMLMGLSMLSTQLGLEYPVMMYDMKFTVSNGKFHFDNRYVGGSAIVDVYIGVDSDNDEVIRKILNREMVATIDNVPTTDTLLSVTIPLSGKEYLKQAINAA